jgi:hypothetical protein
VCSLLVNPYPVISPFGNAVIGLPPMELQTLGKYIIPQGLKKHTSILIELNENVNMAYLDVTIWSTSAILVTASPLEHTENYSYRGNRNKSRAPG